jgi:hypothetical protein
MPTQVVAPTAGGPPAEEPSRFWEYARNGIMMYLASQVTSRGVAYFVGAALTRASLPFSLAKLTYDDDCS